MEFLSQNSTWIIFALVVIAMFFMHRGGHGGHGGHGGFGGFGLGGGGGHGGGGHGGRDEGTTDTAPAAQEAAIDPVSGAAVRTAGAPTAFYQGRLYHFASRENRNRFEAAPSEFAGKAAGAVLENSQPRQSQRHKGHGC